MHELSLCGALAEIVSRRADDRPVGAVHVRVGQLRQVVPETLSFCWEMVVAQTRLEGSVLELERVPAMLRCHSCRATGLLGDSIAVACQSCGSLDVEVTAGEEFDVTALDLVRA